MTTLTNEQLATQAIAGCRASRDLLIERNKPLAIGIASRYMNRRNNDDMIANAIVGLVIAVDTYNPNKGAMFSSYAHTCITNQVFHSMRRERSQTNVRVRLCNATTQSMFVVNDERDQLDLSSIDVKALLDRADLTPVERRVIEGRYGINGERMTLVQLGEQEGCSHQRVQQMEKQILSRLRSLIV